MTSIILSDACALFMLWVFAQAGWHKVSKVNEYYYSNLVSQYFALHQVVNDSLRKEQQLTWIKRLVKFIGVFELGLAFALVIPSTRYFAALLTVAVLLGYMSMMAYQLYRGKLDMDCGCGGSAGQLKISSSLLVRNLSFSVLTLLCLSNGQSEFSSLTVITFVVALIAILLNSIIEQLIANDQQLRLLKN
tara:strand:+ start:7323 stop:7892 length:570 start_codon:yes stop_codon:yes gene_type:complete